MSRRRIQAPKFRGKRGLVVTMATRGISGFWDCWSAMKLPAQWEKRVYPDYDLLRGRNAAARTALELGFDYLLLMDDDHWFPPDALIDRLLAHDKDIVGPLVLSRYPPFRSTAHVNGKKIRWQGETGLLRVDAIGCAGMLIQRRVLEGVEMVEPIFDNDGKVLDEQKVWFRAGAKYPDRIAEDVDFCDRARAKGFEIHCDLDTRMGHYTQTCVFPNEGAPAFAFPGDYVMMGTFNYGDGADTEPLDQVANYSEQVKLVTA